MSESTATFNHWCKVELFGHNVIVGHCTEVSIAGTVFLRVDVPTADGEGVAYTRFFHGNAVYALNPIDKTLALELAKHQATEPIQSYDVSKLTDKIRQSFIPRLPSTSADETQYTEEEES